MECLIRMLVFVRSEKLRSEKNREFDLKSRSSIKKNFQRIALNSQVLVPTHA